MPTSLYYNFGEENEALICESIDLEQTKYKTGNFSEQFFCLNTEILATRFGLFVWCLTARQHRKGQFVPTAEGETDSVG